jgi:polyhydroxyalkanoate synthesis repressor PhaR
MERGGVRETGAVMSEGDDVSKKASSGDEPVTIKKYANRRLYNTATSTYVTLEDLAEMVKAGTDFVVFDAKTGEEITHSVLTQIIFEEETKGQNLLPIRFLRQLIRFYGDSMQTLVPSFLDFSMESLTREQDGLRKQMTQALGGHGFEAMEDQVRQNMAMFEKAMSMFTPFAPVMPNGGDKPAGKDASSKASESKDEDLDALRSQLATMQKQLDALVKKD